MERQTSIDREVRAGCFECHGGVTHWHGPNAQAVAARHHDATNHATWCEIDMRISYGLLVSDPRQVDLEDAIAAATPAGVPA